MPTHLTGRRLVTFTAKDAAGRTLASVDRNLLPNGHGAQNMAPLFALSGFTGSLEITSTEAHRHSFAELRSRSGIFLLAARGNWMLPSRERLPITSPTLP